MVFTNPQAAPLLLGVLLGMRHACDADHVAAVATIVARGRGALRSGFIGAFWGLGHSATLLAIGGAMIGFGWRLPAEFGMAAGAARVVSTAGVIYGFFYAAGVVVHWTRIRPTL